MEYEKPLKNPPKLIVLCRASHSGKSTFAKKLGDEFGVVSSDEIRKRLVQRPR